MDALGLPLQARLKAAEAAAAEKAAEVGELQEQVRAVPCSRGCRIQQRLRRQPANDPSLGAHHLRLSTLTK